MILAGARSIRAQRRSATGSFAPPSGLTRPIRTAPASDGSPSPHPGALELTNFLTFGVHEFDSSASMRRALKSSEAETTGNTMASKHPARMNTREQRTPPALPNRRHPTSVPTESNSHRRLSSTSIVYYLRSNAQ
jgi:hypothetical protein